MKIYKVVNKDGGETQVKALSCWVDVNSNLLFYGEGELVIAAFADWNSTTLSEEK